MKFDLKIMSNQLGKLMWHNNKTIAVAEGCSAGRLSSIITSAPGSSHYYKGGLICYRDETKVQFLGVDPEMIETETAVSENVVKQMVIGTNEMFSTDYAIAISGYAGPGGDANGTCQNGTNIGTSWIAIGNKDRIVTHKIEGEEGREKNLETTIKEAFILLHEYLKEEKEV